MHYSQILRKKRWYLVDESDHVRACLKGCLKSEAQTCAELMFGESMRPTRWPLLSQSQRCIANRMQKLTLDQCQQRLGIHTPLDDKLREARRIRYLSVDKRQAGGVQ